tara:strand:+ start:354 stop:1205 length:852 start_codon:yes stop_codon:yes gene_type:complete
MGELLLKDFIPRTFSYTIADSVEAELISKDYAKKLFSQEYIPTELQIPPQKLDENRKQEWRNRQMERYERCKEIANLHLIFLDINQDVADKLRANSVTVTNELEGILGNNFEKIIKYNNDLKEELLSEDMRDLVVYNEIIQEKFLAEAIGAKDIITDAIQHFKGRLIYSPINGSSQESFDPEKQFNRWDIIKGIGSYFHELFEEGNELSSENEVFLSWKIDNELLPWASGQPKETLDHVEVIRDNLKVIFEVCKKGYTKAEEFKKEYKPQADYIFNLRFKEVA